MSDAQEFEVPTDHGPGRVHLSRPDGTTSGLMLLGHGAGGGINAPDLQAAMHVAVRAGLAVGLVEQPYRVAGRKAPAPAAQVDAAWRTIAAHLHGDGAEFAGLPLVTGGRSFGARVACRTAADTGGDAVLCLAFPVHPPGRPERSRQAELSGVTVPVLVIQGERDPFGMPEGSADCRVEVVPGDHSLRKAVADVRTLVAGWLAQVLGTTR